MPISPDDPKILRPVVAATLFGLGVLSVLLAIIASGRTLQSPASPSVPGGAELISASFTPPSIKDLEPGPETDAILRGRAIFMDTRTHAGDYVGNAMACRNCHLDEGRAANSAPMWGAWVAYPQFRKKTGTINTMADRITQCFRYSMNAANGPAGKPPAADSPVVADLETYFKWLATGAPTGVKLDGAGYPKPVLAKAGYDRRRGAALFAAKCSACHGADGQGASDAAGKVVYPPLWGPRSYNWGAGMARVDLAAGFIKANMPLGEGGSLSDQEVWDVAAFVDSHERPRDPRQTGTVAANLATNFKGQQSFYGQAIDGVLLGSGVAAKR